MKKPTIIYFKSGQSQYQVLNYFRDSYIGNLQKIGFNLLGLTPSMQTFNLAEIKIDNSFVLYMGRSLDDFNISLHKQLPQLPLVNIQVDHPFYCLGLDGTVPSYFPIVIMPDWQDIITTQYTSNQFTGYIPHSAYVPRINKPILPASKRKESIIFPISFTNPEEIRQQWQKRQPNLSHIIEQIIATYINNRFYIPLDQLLINNIELDGAAQKNIAIRELYYYIDSYLRNYWRLETLKTLSNTITPVTVFINNPGQLVKILGHTKNIKIQSAINFDKTLSLMQKYKIVLTSAYQNGLPLFSERIPTAMINGAVSVHSGSPFISTLFTDHLHGVPFNHYTQESLPDMLADLLSDNERLDFIAENGRQHAAAHFSNEVHAQQVVELVADFRQKMPC